eukprot:jgi/Tetstr1/455432/TSEL_042262.t1
MYVMFKGEEEVCEVYNVTPHSEAAVNTNAIKSLAATQAFPCDNVDEGSSPEPPVKKAKASSPPSRRLECRPGAGVVMGQGGRWGRSGRGAAARPP